VAANPSARAAVPPRVLARPDAGLLASAKEGRSARFVDGLGTAELHAVRTGCRKVASFRPYHHAIDRPQNLGWSLTDAEAAGAPCLMRQTRDAVWSASDGRSAARVAPPCRPSNGRPARSEPAQVSAMSAALRPQGRDACDMRPTPILTGKAHDRGTAEARAFAQRIASGWRPANSLTEHAGEKGIGDREAATCRRQILRLRRKV